MWFDEKIAVMAAVSVWEHINYWLDSIQVYDAQQLDNSRHKCTISNYCRTNKSIILSLMMTDTCPRTRAVNWLQPNCLPGANHVLTWLLLFIKFCLNFKLSCFLNACGPRSSLVTRSELVSEQFLNFTSAQLGYTVPFTVTWLGTDTAHRRCVFYFFAT